MDTHPREWRFGKNTYLLEQPDLLWVRFQGVGCLEEVTQSMALYEQLGTVRPFFMLADMEQAEGMEPEARCYFSERFRPEWLLGFIYINTRLIHRSIAMGLLLAYEMTRLEPHPLRGKVHFVSTRAQGRALYAQLSGPRAPPYFSEPPARTARVALR